MTYAEKLKDPRWQKKRLEILERDEWHCQCCGDKESTLMVHHLYYEKGKEPWDYPLEAFKTLCEECHEMEHGVRMGSEVFLLDVLRRRGFSFDDVFIIAEGFGNLTMQSTPNIISSAIWRLLGDQTQTKIVVNNYIDWINRSRKKSGEELLKREP